MKKKIISILFIFSIYIAAYNTYGFSVTEGKVPDVDYLTYHLIDLESPYTPLSQTLITGIQGGYEMGYIPDWYVRPQLSYGLFDWFLLNGNAGYVGFLDQKEKRLAEYELSSKFRIAESSKQNAAIYGYMKFRQSLGEVIHADYEGDFEEVIAMVSPHADKGMDFTAGLSGRFSFFKKRTILVYSADYSLTEFRDYLPDRDNSKNRIFCSLTPALSYSAKEGKSFTMGVQNRYTYWFERGYTYAVMPQISWNITKETAVSAGASIPVMGGGKDYRFIGEISMSFEFGSKTRPTGDVVPAKMYIKLPSDHFSPDGDGTDDICSIYPVLDYDKKIKKWGVYIFDPRGVLFKKFSGTGIAEDQKEQVVKWDGKSDNKKAKITEFGKYKVQLIVNYGDNQMAEDIKYVTIDKLVKKSTKKTKKKTTK